MRAKNIMDTPPERRGFPGRKTIRKTKLERLRKYDKAEVRRLVRDGTLDEYLDSVVEAVEQHGQDLIAQGVMPTEAWRRAVRVHVLDASDD